MNIANDLRLRLQNNVYALDRTFDFPIHNHSLGCNSSVDMSPAGDNERSAVQFAVNLTMDLHQALRGDASHDLQSFSDHRSSASRLKHGFLLRKTRPWLRCLGRPQRSDDEGWALGYPDKSISLNRLIKQAARAIGTESAGRSIQKLAESSKSSRAPWNS
jgi:hypothetical protein